MADIDFDVELIGDIKLQAFFKQMKEIQKHNTFRQMLIDGAVLVEFNAKKRLDEMVYSKPERGYDRKKGAGLYGKTQASRKLETEGFSDEILKTAVISAVHYAKYVFFGTGRFAEGGKGRMEPWVYQDADGKFHRTVGQHPKPYLTKALEDSKKGFLQIMKDAINDVARKEGGS